MMTMYIVQMSHAAEILLWEEAARVALTPPPMTVKKKSSSNLLEKIEHFY